MVSGRAASLGGFLAEHGRWLSHSLTRLLWRYARVTLEDKARHAEILAEADRLQKALLNSIAHNVRTPLASIIGVLSTLQEEEISHRSASSVET